MKTQRFRDNLRLHHQGRSVKLDRWYCLHVWSKFLLELSLVIRGTRPKLTQKHSLRGLHLNFRSERPNQRCPRKSIDHPWPYKGPSAAMVVPVPICPSSVSLNLASLCTRSSERCLPLLSILVRRCHAWPSISPLSLLKLLGWKRILMASFINLSV